MAILVFVVFTQPILNNPIKFVTNGNVEGGIFALEDQKKIIEVALADASELRGKIEELNASLNAIKQEDIKRLDNFLPDSVDEAQLVADINNIARRAGMKIDEVNIEAQGSRQARGQTTNTAVPELATLTASFSTDGSYEQVRTFMNDIALSLRVLDVKNFSFETSKALGNQYSYKITLITYWLK